MVDAGAIAHLAQMILNPDPKLKVRVKIKMRTSRDVLNYNNTPQDITSLNRSLITARSLLISVPLFCSAKYSQRSAKLPNTPWI